MITCTCMNTFLMGLIEVHHCTLILEYREIFDEVRQSIGYPTCCITAIQLVVNAYTYSMD